MFVSRCGGYAAAGRALDEAQLEEERLMYLAQCRRLFAERRGKRVDARRTAGKSLYPNSEQLAG